MEQHKIKSGWIVTCVGSVTQASLRMANANFKKVWNGHFEIVSLVGTLSPKKGSHLHMSISDAEGNCFGGHLLEGNLIYTTAEIVIQEP